MNKFFKIVKSFINYFGIDIRRINPELKNLSFDEILRNNSSREPLIFDVGANKGQSIKRFLDLFENPTIHAFEPVDEAVKIIKNIAQLGPYHLGKESWEKCNFCSIENKTKLNHKNNERTLH